MELLSYLLSEAVEGVVMSIKKIIIGLMLSLLLGSGVASAADFAKGLAAFRSGNHKTAIAEWTPLAEQGHAKAQYNLGLMYSFGWGVLKNDKTSLEWYTKAAEQGDKHSQFMLGSIYRTGQIVLKNHKTSVTWLTKAAEQGHAEAQSFLGYNYELGLGVLKDHRRAYMWRNLANYNNGDSSAGVWRDELAKQMTQVDISRAQDMSSRCLESNYTDC